MNRTTAVIFESLNEVTVREVDLSPPAPDEVQVETTVSFISPGTEGWVLQNVFTWQPTVYPSVPGYQRVGRVVAVGEGVAEWKPGDLVAATRGRTSPNLAPMWGSHARHINTPASEIYRIPEGVSSINAAGFVVAQVGFNAASRVQMAESAWVVVYGDGIIGQCAAQAARARGAKVILVGHRDERLALGQAVGIEGVVNRKSTNAVAAIRAITGEETVCAVLDSIQGEGPQFEYCDLLAHGEGQIVYCGFSSTATWADMGELQKRELTTHFVSGWKRPRLEATLDLMAQGKMRLEPLVTHRVPFSQAPEMYGMIRSKAAPFLGIAFDWE